MYVRLLSPLLDLLTKEEFMSVALDFSNSMGRALFLDGSCEWSRLSPDQREVSCNFKNLKGSISLISKKILRNTEKTAEQNHLQAKAVAGLILNKLEVLRIDLPSKGVSPDVIIRAKNLQRSLLSIRDAPFCDPRVFGRRVNKVAFFAGVIALEIEKC